MFKSIHHQVPVYISNLLTDHTSNRKLRSTSSAAPTFSFLTHSVTLLQTDLFHAMHHAFGTVYRTILNSLILWTFSRHYLRHIFSILLIHSDCLFSRNFPFHIVVITCSFLSCTLCCNLRLQVCFCMFFMLCSVYCPRLSAKFLVLARC